MSRQELTEQFVRDIHCIAAEHGVNAAIKYVKELQSDKANLPQSQSSDNQIMALHDAIDSLAYTPDPNKN